MRVKKQESFYGLVSQPRKYQCLVSDCGNIQWEGTNHTGPLFMECKGCSWRGGTVEPCLGKAEATYYNAQQKSRPAIYAGEMVLFGEINPLGWASKLDLIADHAAATCKGFHFEVTTPLYVVAMRHREAASYDPEVETEGMDAEVTAEVADSGDFSRDNH